MARKLKDLAVTKVDFVDQGANPDAHIRLFKRKDALEGKGEEGAGTQEVAGKKGIWKRFFHSFAKAAGMEETDIRHIMDDVEKGNSFAEELNARRNCKITDEIWDLCFALNSALCSTINDAELEAGQAEESMQESIRQFSGVMEDAISEWSSGRTAGIIRKNDDKASGAQLEAMKSARDRLSAEIKKASAEPEEIMEPEKGEAEEMRIDKSKLTPAERAFLEDIEKRCGEENGGQENEAGSGAQPDSGTAEGGTETPAGGQAGAVGKSIPKENATDIPDVPEQQTAGTSDDIYKGLHPDVAAELEALKKFRDDAQNRELSEVAKKYAIIGKKEEELVPLFKSLKEAGGTAYNDMIAVLDQAVSTVEKSGVFGEIGKSGGNGNGNSAEGKIDGIAKGYLAKDPSLTYQEALAKAWEDNPDILAEYEEQEGF